MSGFLLSTLTCGILLAQASGQGNLTPRELPPVGVVEAQPAAASPAVQSTPALEPEVAKETELTAPAEAVPSATAPAAAPQPQTAPVESKPVAAFWVIVPGK